MQGDVWENYLDEDHFNAGVLSLEPNMDDFVEMIADYRNYTVYQNEGQAEQAISLFNWFSLVCLSDWHCNLHGLKFSWAAINKTDRTCIFEWR